MTHLNCEKFTIWFDTSQPIYAIKTKQAKKLKFREMKIQTCTISLRQIPFYNQNSFVIKFFLPFFRQIDFSLNLKYFKKLYFFNILYEK